MRFSDFLLVSNPTDLDFIVGYTDDQNIRINVLDLFAGQIIGSGTAGYIPLFTSANVIDDSVLYQDGSNIVIGGEDSLGYRLAIAGSLLALDGAVIESSTPGSDTFRTVGEEGDSFIIPNDSDESVWTSRRIMHAAAVLSTESATLGQVNTAVSDLEGDIEILLDLKVDKSSVGEPNGVASLDATGKIPLSEIPDSIIGQVEYMGTWDAFTNTPTLNPLVPEQKGHYYVVSAAGVFGGVDYAVGDWIISNGVEWQKVDNTDAVTSVFGRIGAILPLEADYQSFYPRLSQAYDNPTWINSLAFTKITDVPPFLLENQTITLSGDVMGSGKTSISSTISNNAVSNEKLRDSVGTSVIGRSASSTGDPADIQASTDGHVLLRSAGNLLFGLISSDSISSIDWSKITGTPTTLGGYGITDAYTKTESDNKFVPYTGANANVNLGLNSITANSFIKVGGTSAQFLKADGSVDLNHYVPNTRSVNAGTGLTGGGNLSSDITIAFDTAWGDNRYAYRTRQLTINGVTYDLSADRTWVVGTVNNLTTIGTSGPATLVGNTLNIPDYTTDLSGYVTLATDQTITGLKTIVRSGDVLNFKIGADTLYGLKLFYSQNEISPSGEATWSFVNTFNRDGSGYEVTPLSFFRGILVTGDRLVSSSVNSNLLDYYSNNPTGRYPVYTYNTGVQQFSDRVLVGFNTGAVDPVTGLISNLPTGVIANFNGRVIGANAVNSNEFVTLGQIPTLTGYVPYTGATQNVDLGEYGFRGGFLGFDLTPTGTPTGLGTMYWDPTYRTASLVTGTGATTIQIGQEEVLLVHNNTGVALTDGQVVYVTGSTGDLPSVSLADASSETTSAATLGVVTETIANGANGFVTLSGIVNGLNTLPYTEGDILWLSETSGEFTNVKPVSPAHLVLIGYVIKRAGGNGSIFVKIQNTQELAESSDVLISAPEIDGQGLFLQTIGTVQLWRNRSIADVLGYTPANAARTLTINGTTYDLSANRTWSVGTVTSVGLSSATSGVTIGSTPVTSSGTITLAIATASGSQNGLLSSADWTTFNNKQNALTNPVTGTGTTNYLPKFTGASTIGNSQVFDNGTNVGIGTASPLTKLMVQDSANTYVGHFSGLNQANGIALGTNSSNVAVIQGYTRTFSATNNIAMQADGGNVLIGTTTDFGYKLAVDGGIYLTNGANRQIFIGSATNYNYRLRTDGDDFVITEAGVTDRLRYSYSTSRWIISAASTFSSSVTISSSAPVLNLSGTVGSPINTINFSASTTSFGTIISNGGSGEQRYSIGPSAGWGGYHTFYTDTAERFRISPTGFVSAGATTNGRLGVRGFTNDSSGYAFEAANASGNTLFIVRNDGLSTFAGNVGINTYSPASPLHIVTPTGVNFQNAIRFEKAGGFGETNLGNYYTSGSNYGLNIDVAGSTVMVANNLGRVGIGTANPLFRTDSRDSLIVSNTQPASNFTSNTGEFYIRGEVRYDMGPTINYYPSIWRQRLENIGVFSGTSNLVWTMSANGGAYTEYMRLRTDSLEAPAFVPTGTSGGGYNGIVLSSSTGGLLFNSTGAARQDFDGNGHARFKTSNFYQNTERKRTIFGNGSVAPNGSMTINITFAASCYVSVCARAGGIVQFNRFNAMTLFGIDTTDPSAASNSPASSGSVQWTAVRVSNTSWNIVFTNYSGSTSAIFAYEIEINATNTITN